tara:strand:- start:600 stop:989 length:390 start_codon:yes stop_codon:yes gene_type:complete
MPDSHSLEFELTTATPTAYEVLEMQAGEARNVLVSFDALLDAGVKLTGTPTITSATDAGGTGTATLGSKLVTTRPHTCKGKPLGVARGVDFAVSATTAGDQYTITISVANDANTAETLVAKVRIVSVSA